MDPRFFLHDDGYFHRVKRETDAGLAISMCGALSNDVPPIYPAIPLNGRPCPICAIEAEEATDAS